ncbi:unnamed protein product [Ilex paraguariensis]
MENIEKNLLWKAMEGDWEEVLKIYNEKPDAHMTQIRMSGNTALHIAVTDGKENIVEQLVSLICERDPRAEALKIKNHEGNTSLHLAVAFGSLRMCRCIAKADPGIIGVRNNNGETPFFWAGLYGKKDAFLCLHFACGGKKIGQYYCRRADGDTILHRAIDGEFIELAFQILQLYENLPYSYNAKGMTPLHLLASIFVNGLKEMQTNGQCLQENPEDKKNPSHPENYKTCVLFFGLLRKIIHVIVNTGKTTEGRNELPSAGNPKYMQFSIPSNYQTCYDTIKLLSKGLLIILGVGYGRVTKIQEKKEKHTWAVQVMNILLEHASKYEYDHNGGNPHIMSTLDSRDLGETVPSAIGEGDIVGFGQDIKGMKNPELETPILVAAKYGVAEMVEKILEVFPMAIHDMNSKKKNIVLLAVEHRQPHVFQLLLQKNIMKDIIFHQVDSDGNSALHLAAALGAYRPWLIPGAALQLQWELKWFEFVKNSMPPHFYVHTNNEGKTPKDISRETHTKLVEDGGNWLTNTSESCSVVAALIATVAFATSATVPGGVKQDSGVPTLENEPAFNVFAVSSLIALCFSVTAVVMFLAILTSRYQERDFAKDLPRKLLIGLTSLFISIAAILVSFCAGHFFVIKDKLKYAAYPVYAITCLPITFFAMAQFPLYIDLIWTTIKKIPQRSYEALPLT